MRDCGLGLISWRLAGLFIAGGITGGVLDTRSARPLSERRGALNFAAIIIAMALYMLARNLSLS